MAKAIWNETVIAESTDTQVIEGNHYFPPDSIKPEFFTKSDATTVCGWKGTANYYDLVVNDSVNPQAAWYYTDPKPEAAISRVTSRFGRALRSPIESNPRQITRDSGNSKSVASHWNQLVKNRQSAKSNATTIDSANREFVSISIERFVISVNKSSHHFPLRTAWSNRWMMQVPRVGTWLIRRGFLRHSFWVTIRSIRSLTLNSTFCSIRTTT